MSNNDTKRTLAIIMAVILFCLNIPENMLIMLADNLRQQETERDSQLEIVHLTISPELEDGTKYESGTWTNKDVTVYAEVTSTDAETTSTDTEVTSTDANVYKVVRAATDTDSASALELDYDGQGKYSYKVECEENKIISQEQYFWTIDDNKNPVSESKSIIINIDKAAPEITKIEYETIDGLRNEFFAGRYSILNSTLNSTLEKLVFKDRIRISMDAEDIGSGIKTIQYKTKENWEPLSPQAIKITPLGENKNNYSFFVDISNLTDEANLFFKVTDNAGNDSEEDSLNNVILAKSEDKNIKVIAKMKTKTDDEEYKEYKGDKWTNKSVVINLGTYYKEEFSLSALNNQYKYMINEEPEAKWKKIGKDKKEYTIEAEEGEIINRTYYFMNSSIDDESTASTKSDGYSVKIDRAKPKILSLESKNAAGNTVTDWYNGNITITGTASDEGAGVDKIVYSINKDLKDEDIKNLKDTAEYDEKENVYKLNINVEKGDILEATYYFWAIDKAGNVSEISEIQIKIDKKAPTIGNILFVSFDKESNENIFAGRFKGSIINNNIDYLVFKDHIKVNIEISDEGSGIDESGFSYQLTDENGTVKEDKVNSYTRVSNESGYAVIILNSKDIASKISIKAVDKVGNGSQKEAGKNEQVILSSEGNVIVKADFSFSESENKNISYEKGWINKNIKVDLGTYYIGKNEKYRLTDKQGNENYIYNRLTKLPDDIENVQDWDKLNSSSYEIDVKEGDVLDEIYLFKNVSLINSEKTISKEYHVQIDKKKPVIHEESLRTEDSNNQKIENWYNKEIKIKGVAEDIDSGISKIVYKYVEYENDEISAIPNYTDKNFIEVETIEEIDKRTTVSFGFPVEPDKNGKYYIYAVDNAGNFSEISEIEIRLDKEAPQLDEIIYKQVEDKNGTIKILNNQMETEWDGDGDKLTILGNVKDNLSGVSKVVYKYIEAGEEVPNEKEIKNLEDTAELGLPNESSEIGGMIKYSYSISIPNEILNEKGEKVPNNLDGSYYIWVIDMAGNVSDCNTIHIRLDNTAPDNLAMNIELKDSQGNDRIDKIDIHDIDDSLLYKHFYNTEIYISLLATDNEKNASEIKMIEYQKVLKGERYQEDNQWVTYTSPIPIEIINDQFIIYFKVTDYAGNQTIKAGDGIVVDDKSPVGSDYEKPEITIKLQAANSNGYYGLEYGENIYADIDVSDPPYIGENLTEDTEKGYFSGIHSISYKIVTDGKITESKEDLYSFDGNYENLEQKKQIRVEIPTAINNSNNVILSVTAIDNAGNIKTTETKLGDIKIDVTCPTIDIVYDNNSPLNERYYKDDRTATITITERNFSPENVVVNISNSYGEIPVISSWTDAPGSGNGDNTWHQAKITWHADGDYQFNISYKDLAGNQDTGMNFAAGTQNSTRFIIDQTNPEINISYNNNQPLNEFYYNSDRIATIVVTERNFNPEEVVVNINNPYGNVPSISDWTTNGLNHTATITYSEDGDYTFGIGYADLAGNKNNMETYSADSKNTNFFILDKTVPEILVSYNNNNPSEERYYNADRTATIRIIERNFKGEEVITEIQNTDNVIPQVGEWGRDNFTNLNSITYAADGDYTFNMRYTDLAGNTAGAVQYENGTVNPSEFTIDQTAPVITVSYDNNASSNGKYFNAERTATITVEEHNFNPADITYTQTAVKKGEVIDIPAVSSWIDSGDTHTATINYNMDGDYTFDMSMTDMSGNPNNSINYTSVAAQDFTVDLSINKLEITGIENGKPYRDEVKPKITFSDINLNGDYEVKLTRTKKDIINEDVTKEFIGDLLEQNGDEVSGEIDTFEKIRENDGIYTLYVRCQDLAGNKKENTVVFSINRFGSVYVLSEDLINLKNTYTQKAEGKLVITEYNPDKLIENSLNVEITKDGQPLEKEAVYTVTPEINEYVSVGESGWYQYAYTISEENFENDGVYKVIVSSQDQAGNQPETTRDEESRIIFTVDTVAPEITNITGLENAVVNATEINADYEVFDSIGLKCIQVYIDDKEVLRQDKFDDLTVNKGSFTVMTGANQHIKLVATDLAGNIIDTDSDQFNPAYKFKNDITVSTNFFVRWYAQKALFYGTIISFVAVASGLIVLIIWKKSKKQENASE